MPRQNDIDLNLLRTFHCFARTRSVRKTAQALGRSVPAISARLHQLQRELEVDLFVRSGRGLALTPIGRLVSSRASNLLGGVHELLDLVAADGGHPAGVLRVGALPTVGVFVLGPLLPHFATACPDVQVELEYGAQPAAAALGAGEIDVALGVGRAPADGLRTFVIDTVRPVLVTGSGVHLTAATPWVGYGPTDDAFFDAVWAYQVAQGIAPRVHHRVRHIETLKALVNHGAGAAILPDYTVSASGLQVHPVDGLDLSMDMWLAVRPSAVNSPAVAAFSDAVRRSRV